MVESKNSVSSVPEHDQLPWDLLGGIVKLLEKIDDHALHVKDHLLRLCGFLNSDLNLVLGVNRFSIVKNE